MSYEQTIPLYADANRGNTFERVKSPSYEPDFDYEHLITEDDEPVDNIFSEKQQRILTESLYSSWSGPSENRSFLALANVGLYYDPSKQPLVPDVLVSLDVLMPDDVWQKRNRSYFVKRYGKAPEVVIEIVSNKKGHETDTKLKNYAQAGVRYYVILDPKEQLNNGQLCVYELQNNRYVKTNQLWLSEVQLGLTLWEGQYEDKYDVWLRWCDKNGHLIATGKEKAFKERQEKEKALEHAKRLAAKLRELGIDPETLD